MPEDLTGNSPAQPPVVSNPQPTNPGFTMPEKFVGKSAEDIAKSYAELESKYGEAGKKLGDLDRYSKIGSPDDIQAVITWGQQMKAALDQGLLVPKEQAGKQPAADSGRKSAPWEADDWAYKSPREQWEAFQEQTQRSNREYIDSLAAQYGKQIQDLTAQDGRQKSILLKAISSAIKNPNTSPEDILAEAASLGTKTPEELIDMVLEARGNSPAARKAEIDRIVAEQVALKLQEEEAKRLTDITGSITPKHKFGQQSKSREDENRQIISELQKKGIRLL